MSPLFAKKQNEKKSSNNKDSQEIKITDDGFTENISFISKSFIISKQKKEHKRSINEYSRILSPKDEKMSCDRMNQSKFLI